MIVENFIVKGEEQLQELKAFVETSHNAAFRSSPIYNARKNIYSVSLRYGISALAPLEALQKKWEEENNKKAKARQESKNAFSNFFALLSFSSS